MKYFSVNEKQYLPLPGNDCSDQELRAASATRGSSFEDTRRSTLHHGWIFMLCLNVILFSISVVLLVISVQSYHRVELKTNSAWRAANTYSPIVDEIPIPLRTQKMKGTLIDYDHDIYRQLPSPAVDAAWEKLTEHGFSYVTEAQALKMGWDLSTTAKIPESLKPGHGAYYAGETDIIHKIHCLNMIRKDVFFDYYWGEMYPDGDPSERHKIHSSHCLYIILQSLMCDANTDMIPHVYLEDYAWPVPDFEINRKCGNFEGVKHWEATHSVALNETVLKLLEKTEGQTSRPMTDEFRRVFEVDLV